MKKHVRRNRTGWIVLLFLVFALKTSNIQASPGLFFQRTQSFFTCIGTSAINSMSFFSLIGSIEAHMIFHKKYQKGKGRKSQLAFWLPFVVTWGVHLLYNLICGEKVLSTVRYPCKVLRMLWQVGTGFCISMTVLALLAKVEGMEKISPNKKRAPKTEEIEEDALGEAVEEPENEPAPTNICLKRANTS